VAREMSVRASADALLPQLPPAGKTKRIRSLMVACRRVICPILRCVEILAVHGWKTPLVALKRLLHR